MMRPSVLPSEPQIVGSLDGAWGSVRPAMDPSDVLVAAAGRLLERASLPLRVRQDLHSLKRQTRRIAADRSGFALVMNAMVFVNHPADALYFPRLLEAEAYGRCTFPTLAPDIAHASESDANRDFDIAQINRRCRKDASSLDELLYTALVQEVATKAVAASEASEMRVRSVLMGR